MFCIQCGTELPKHARFCPDCGEKVDKPQSAIKKESLPEANRAAQDAALNQTKGLKKRPISVKNKLLGIALLCILAALLTPLMMTAGIREPVKLHLAALNRGEIEAAYRQTSQVFQQKTSLDQFKAFIDAYPELIIQNRMDVTERLVDDSKGRVSGVLANGEHQLVTAEFLMTQEDGSWKIKGFQLAPTE